MFEFCERVGLHVDQLNACPVSVYEPYVRQTSPGRIRQRELPVTRLIRLLVISFSPILGAVESSQILLQKTVANTSNPYHRS